MFLFLPVTWYSYLPTHSLEDSIFITTLDADLDTLIEYTKSLASIMKYAKENEEEATEYLRGMHLK